MNNIKRFIAVFASAIFTIHITYAQDAKEAATDSLVSNKEVQNRNVMLNASADNQPREISIGLPTGNGSLIFEDGLPVSYWTWPCVPYKSWTGGVSYRHTGLLSLGETALRYGQVAYSVDSHTREGGERFAGFMNYTVNHFGLQRFDINLSGPIGSGWSYTVGTYQNFDTGSNELKFAPLQNRTQAYKFGLTKVWNENRGKVSIFYKYTDWKNAVDTNGPFWYEGDGSVTQLDGFRLGKDAYLPADDNVMLMNIVTGEPYANRLGDGYHDYGHDVNVNLSYRFNDNLKLTVSSKYKNSKAHILLNSIAGIDRVEKADGYTYSDGTPFAGDLQQRFLMRDVGFTHDWLTNAELTGRNGNHSWRIGLNEFYNQAGMYASTAMTAHEVKADPSWLYHQGNSSWDFNTGGEYYDGHENKLALYASDDWQITDYLWMSAGVRLEYYNIGGKAAMNVDGNTNNSRIPGFNLQQEGVTVTSFGKNWVNPAFTFNGRYTLLPGFGISAEYVFNSSRPNLQDFAGVTPPIYAPIDIHMFQGGLFYNNNWMQLNSRFFYISQSNYKQRAQFTKQLESGNSETITESITYDVATMGWTTDAVLNPFKGFTFHGLFTIQNPLYKDFVLNPVFSDGSAERYDFSDRNVTAMSKVIVELDPSYTIDRWRIWASFRYQSRQYINKTNSLYFNGRWETFAGLDFTLNKHVTLSANVVNLLNQKGVSGAIAAADLVEDVSAYHHYLMAGTYIRPFTVELTARIKF